MQKIIKKNEYQNRVPQEQTTSIEKVETPSLLAANEARNLLKKLDGWQLTDDHKMLYREFILKDFRAAVQWIDHIAVIAEDEKHHPDIHLTKYRNLRVALTTHDVHGLSEKDFIVAGKVNELPAHINEQKQIVIPEKSDSKTVNKTKKTLGKVNLKKTKESKMEKKNRGGGNSKSSSKRQAAQSLGGRIKARNRSTSRKPIS